MISLDARQPRNRFRVKSTLPGKSDIQKREILYPEFDNWQANPIFPSASRSEAGGTLSLSRVTVSIAPSRSITGVVYIHGDGRKELERLSRNSSLVNSERGITSV